MCMVRHGAPKHAARYERAAALSFLNPSRRSAHLRRLQLRVRATVLPAPGIGVRDDLLRGAPLPDTQVKRVPFDPNAEHTLSIQGLDVPPRISLTPGRVCSLYVLKKSRAQL